MKNKLDIIEKAAKKQENKLKKLFKETYEAIKEENIKNGLGDELFFAECAKTETDDCHHGEVKKEKDGVCVWVSNVWVNSNKLPQNVEIIDGRLPVKAVSYWYTPYHYGLNNGMTPERLYEESEKEKILYEDFDIKVSLIRRNVIPFFKSFQYCHKMSKQEYVIYLRREKNDVRQSLHDVIMEINTLRRSKENIPNELIERQNELRNNLYFWHEVVHDDNLNKVFIKAKRYFNDWYY